MRLSSWSIDLYDLRIFQASGRWLSIITFEITTLNFRILELFFRFLQNVFLQDYIFIFLCLFCLNNSFFKWFLLLRHIDIFWQIVFNPCSPSTEITLLSAKWFFAYYTLHDGRFMEVDVNTMPNYTPWAIRLSACNDPFFFRIEAVSVRCTCHLIEDSELYQVRVILNYHSDFDNVALTKLLDISFINSAWNYIVAV